MLLKHFNILKIIVQINKNKRYKKRNHMISSNEINIFLRHERHSQIFKKVTRPPRLRSSTIPSHAILHRRGCNSTWNRAFYPPSLQKAWLVLLTNDYEETNSDRGHFSPSCSSLISDNRPGVLVSTDLSPGWCEI